MVSNKKLESGANEAAHCCKCGMPTSLFLYSRIYGHWNGAATRLEGAVATMHVQRWASVTMRSLPIGAHSGTERMVNSCFCQKWRNNKNRKEPTSRLSASHFAHVVPL